MVRSKTRAEPDSQLLRSDSEDSGADSGAGMGSSSQGEPKKLFRGRSMSTKPKTAGKRPEAVWKKEAKEAYKKCIVSTMPKTELLEIADLQVRPMKCAAWGPYLSNIPPCLVVRI